MYNVAELLRHKGSGVETILPSLTVLDAARRMNERHIGSLIVAEHGKLIGIITERDILRKIVADGRDPASTYVSDIMTRRVLTCSCASELDQIRGIMRDKHIRHVPIVDDGRLAGMISIGDLNAAEAQTLTDTIHFLEDYIQSA